MAAKILSSRGALEQRVPAWKRLGLQLKSSSSGGNGIGPAVSDSTALPTTVGKRKHHEPDTASNHTVAPGKADTPPRNSVGLTGAGSDGGNLSKLAKASGEQPVSAGSFTQNEKKPKRKNTTKHQQAPENSAAQPDMTTSLAYLRQWRTAQGSWKFNKNSQTLLVKHVFDPLLLPASDIEAFYDYVQGLQGYVRIRLCEAATRLKDDDIANTSANDHAEYAKLIASLVQPTRGSLRTLFREDAFLRGSKNATLADRAVRRMRAEIVSQELSGQGGHGQSGTDGSHRGQGSGEGTDVKRAKLNDGRHLPRPRKRRVVGYDESSSESNNGSEDSGDDGEEEEEEEDTDEDEEEEEDEEEVEENKIEVTKQKKQKKHEKGKVEKPEADDDEDEDESEDEDGDEDEEDGSEEEGERRKALVKVPGAESDSSSSCYSTDTSDLSQDKCVAGPKVGKVGKPSSSSSSSSSPSSSSSSSSSSDNDQNARLNPRSIKQGLKIRRTAGSA